MKKFSINGNGDILFLISAFLMALVLSFIVCYAGAWIIQALGFLTTYPTINLATALFTIKWLVIK
jgi:hypothetical protein